MFTIADKRKTHLRDKSVSNYGGEHLHAIRHHLNLLEQNIHHEPEASTWQHNDHADSLYEQSPSQTHLQSQITAKIGWPTRQHLDDEDKVA